MDDLEGFNITKKGLVYFLDHYQDIRLHYPGLAVIIGVSLACLISHLLIIYKKV